MTKVGPRELQLRAMRERYHADRERALMDARAEVRKIEAAPRKPPPVRKAKPKRRRSRKHGD